MYCCYCFFFFFQAEDGIRDWSVTGVQTCALPILTTSPGDGPTENESKTTAKVSKSLSGGMIAAALQIGRASCRERV